MPKPEAPATPPGGPAGIDPAGPALAGQPGAAIALFVFNRPGHTRRCLASLAQNPAFTASPLFIFSDGPRGSADLADVAAVRRLVQDWPHPDKRLHEAHSNAGLAASVIAGVTQVCEQTGEVIVIEDDLLLAPTFLAYMNRALARYRDEPRVMQISGHMYPVDLSGSDDAVFLPLASSWGWATWQRAWQRFDPTMRHFDTLAQSRQLRRRFNADGAMPYFSYLERQRRGQADSWFIRWYLSLFMDQGLVLHPRDSLVRNGGFDGTGVHCGSGGSPYDAATPMRAAVVDRLPAAELDPAAFASVRRFLASQNTFLARARRRIRLAARRWGGGGA